MRDRWHAGQWRGEARSHCFWTQNGCAHQWWLLYKNHGVHSILFWDLDFSIEFRMPQNSSSRVCILCVCLCRQSLLWLYLAVTVSGSSTWLRLALNTWYSFLYLPSIELTVFSTMSGLYRKLPLKKNLKTIRKCMSGLPATWLWTTCMLSVCRARRSIGIPGIRFMDGCETPVDAKIWTWGESRKSS